MPTCDVCFHESDLAPYVVIYEPVPPYAEEGGEIVFLAVCGLCVELASAPDQQLLSLHDPCLVGLPHDYHTYDHWLKDQQRSGPSGGFRDRETHAHFNHNT